MISLVILLALLQIGDLLTTEKILGAGGKELNPVMNYLFSKFGMHNVLVVKAVAVSCFGIWVYTIYPLVLIPLCVLYLGVVGWNSYQILNTKGKNNGIN